MKKGTKIILGVVGMFSLFTLIGIFTVIGKHNDFVAQEEGLEAQYKDNQNVYDNFVKKVKEVAQVPDLYIDGLRKVYIDTMASRYGKGGSKAMWQWIKEHNPTVDASVYKKIQQVIEGGRKDFEIAQTTLLDKKKIYQTKLRTFPGSVIAGMFGFPKLDLDNIDIILSTITKKKFDTKVDDEIIKLK